MPRSGRPQVADAAREGLEDWCDPRERTSSPPTMIVSVPCSAAAAPPEIPASRNVTVIDLALCEEGIGHARETMNEVISGYISQKKPR